MIIKLGDQHKPFTPHICCKTCLENLWDLRTGKRKSIAIQKVWREEKDQITHCYFCMESQKGINRKNKYHVQYPDVPSAMRPIPHWPVLPVFELDGNMEYSSDSEPSVTCCSRGWRIQTRRGRPVNTLGTSIIQRPDTRPVSFKDVCSAAGFTSLREISVDTRNNNLLVSRLWDGIKTVFYVAG